MQHVGMLRHYIIKAEDSVVECFFHSLHWGSLFEMGLSNHRKAAILWKGGCWWIKPTGQVRIYEDIIYVKRRHQVGQDRSKMGATIQKNPTGHPVSENRRIIIFEGEGRKWIGMRWRPSEFHSVSRGFCGFSDSKVLILGPVPPSNMFRL